MNQADTRIRQVRFTLIVTLSLVVLLIPVYLAQGLPWTHAIAAALIVITPGAALVALVWRIESRSGSSRWPRRVFRALMFSGAWTLAITALSYLVHPAAALAFLHNGAIWQLIGGLVLYLAVAAWAQTSVVKAALREREMAATRAELNALQTQLNPHFLFNTLHALTQLAREDATATEEALQQFGDLMRYVLKAGQCHYEAIPLEDELAFIRNYLQLERLRFGERLQVEEQIDPDCLELGIPPLLLQPLVENAVRHGIAPLPQGGVITLAVRLDGDNLLLEVRDTGSGADAKEWLNANGVGLAVVRRQIEARYPGTGHFQVLTSPGNGFTARIRLPVFLPPGET